MSDGGHPIVLLLHGLGTTGAVWHGVESALRASGIATLAPDLPGHGAAAPVARYDLDTLAGVIARDVPAHVRLVVVGHSLGGYVALALASGDYGLAPSAVLSLGAKLTFTGAERARAAEIAAKPARRFATREEALARYRLVAGLPESIARDDAYLARGIVECEGGWRLSTDPAAFSIGVPPFAALAGRARCAVRIARGEHDAIVTRAEYVALGLDALDLAALGHNAQVEDPAAVVRLVRGMLDA